MKLFHLSDLHIGKQLNGYNLVDEQYYILDRIVELIKEHKPNGVLISGDIYDKAAPSGEAFEMYNHLLNRFSEVTNDTAIMIIAGNHDSNDRLNFGSDYFGRHNIYVSACLPSKKDEYLKKIELSDEYGSVDFYLLPFLKPGYVRGLFDEEIKNSHQAIEKILKRENIDYSKRNVLLSHQFYVNGSEKPRLCDSEMILTVGDADEISVNVVKDFDYVALGHIHGCQKVGYEHIRYSGTPLKYSVSEANDEKSITVVELFEKGEAVKISHLPLIPKRDVRKLKGSLKEVIDMANEQNRSDYVSIILTDEADLFMPKDMLLEYYNNILELRIENSTTKAVLEQEVKYKETLTPYDALCSFYKEVFGLELNEEQKKYIENLISEIGGDEDETN